MKADTLKIDEMRLSIPGLSQETANMLGRDVIKRISKKLPENMRSRKLASLDVTVRIPQGTPKEQFAEMIAEQICRSLV